MPPSVISSRVAGAAMLVVVLTALPLRPAVAQSGYPSGPPGAEQYRLTMPMLRKVLPALQGAGRTRCEKNPKPDPFAMTLAELTAALERCAPVRAAVAKTGVTTKEAATVLGAFLYAGRRITQEESALAVSTQAPPLPSGPLKDNVALLREHEAELRQLTQPPARAGS